MNDNPNHQQLADANASRLFKAIDAMHRLEAKLQAADAAVREAEEALWGAGFERSEVDHRLRSDTPSAVSYLAEQQQLVLLRSKFAEDLKAIAETKKTVYAEIAAYRNVQGAK